MTPARLRAPRAATFALAAALALAFAHSVFRIPVQVSDSLDAIVAAARAPSATRLLLDASQWSGEKLRPTRFVQARWLLALADSTGLSYNAVFRGAHAALVMLLLFAFVACLPVETWTDVAAAGLCLTVFTGLHTFTALTREAFPVNHFAETTCVALATLAIARRRPRWPLEILVLALLGFCLLLIETAVLLWVVIVACAAARMPGIRWRTVAAATLVLLLYFGARWTLDIKLPAIGAAGSGYGGTFYSGAELRERFGANPVPFFAYNIAGGVLSVLFSEPRFGVYQLATPRAHGTLSPVVPINMVASAAVTFALAWYIVGIVRRRRSGLRDEDRIVVVAVVVLGASAVLCAAYMKDEILAAAGALYALAAFAPIRGLLEWTAAPGRRPMAVALAAIFVAGTASLWAFRAVGAHYELRRTAYVTRNDWALILLPGEHSGWPKDPTELAITRRLKDEALQWRTASPSVLPRWGERYWVE